MRSSFLKTVFLSLLATAFLSSCALMRGQLKDPEVSVGDLRVTDMTLSDAQIAVDVLIKNPNSFGISMNGLTYGLQIEDKPLFSGTLNDKVKVNADETSRVTLPFRLKYEDVLGTLAALGSQRELRYQLKGKVDLGLFSLPYTKEGKFRLPSLPDISLQSLHVDRVGIGGVELALKVKVTNANAFPIRLDGLNYDLKLADVALLQGQSSQPLSVDGHGDGLLELKMAVDYSKLGSLLDKLRTAKSLPVEFNSRVKVPGEKGEASLPYVWKGEVPLQR